MNREEKRRLARLEEAAAKREREELPPGRILYGRHRPYYNQERFALSKGMEEWRLLMRQHGWTDEELDAEIEWENLVARRIADAGLEELEEMCDVMNFLAVYGRDERYPGPGFWDPGEADLPYPNLEIYAERAAAWEARQEAARGEGGPYRGESR